MGKLADILPLDTGAYLSATQGLTTLQHGAYLLLIFAYWNQGPLPPRHSELARIAGVEPAAWKNEVWPVLAKFFTRDLADGLLHQRRLDEERAKRGKGAPGTAPIAKATPLPAKGKRLPEDWEPKGFYAEFARRGGLNPERVGLQFRDYWRARPGEGGCKADWAATWRIWCRRTEGWVEFEAAPAAAPKPAAAPQKTVQELGL